MPLAALSLPFGAAFTCALSALRGTSGGATMTIPGGDGHNTTPRCVARLLVLGAPASIMGSELSVYLTPALRFAPSRCPKTSLSCARYSVPKVPFIGSGSFVYTATGSRASAAWPYRDGAAFRTSPHTNSPKFAGTEFSEVRAWKDEHEGSYLISKIILSLPPVVSPSLLRAAEYEEPEQHETRSRADQHRGELGHIAPDQRREVRVGHQSMRHQPQHYGAYPYAHRCLEAERSYLLGIVAGVVSEGPERIPQIAVGVR